MPLIFAIVLLIASFVIQALTQPKTPKPKPNAITDFQFPQSAEGRPMCVVFGDCWVPDQQILWYGNFRNSEIKSSPAKKG